MFINGKSKNVNNLHGISDKIAIVSCRFCNISDSCARPSVVTVVFICWGGDVMYNFLYGSEAYEKRDCGFKHIIFDHEKGKELFFTNLFTSPQFCNLIYI